MLINTTPRLQMPRKIKKVKFINLVLAGCILSTTIAPSAQAGWGDIFKKLVPSFLTGKTSSCDTITPEQTEMTTQKESTEEIDNTIINAKLATKLFAIGSIAISVIYAIKKYLRTKKTKISESELKKSQLAIPEKEIQTIKKLAQDLKLDENEIKKIKIFYDKNKQNYYASISFFDFANLIILGQSNELQKYAEKKLPNLKHFTYAHELSHIKYGHSKSKIMFFLPEITKICCSTAGAIFIDKILEIIISSIMPKNIETKLKIATKNTILHFTLFILKIVFLEKISSHIKKLNTEKLTNPLLLSIRRKNEVQADLSASSLGEDTIIGGIIGFEINKKIDDATKNKYLAFENLIKKLKEETYQLFELTEKHLLNNDFDTLTKISKKYNTITKIIKEITIKVDNTIGKALKKLYKDISLLHYELTNTITSEIIKNNDVDKNKISRIKEYAKGEKILLNYIKTAEDIFKKDGSNNNNTHPENETRIAYLKNLLSEEKKAEIKTIKDKLFYEFELNKKDLNEAEKITNIIFQNIEAFDSKDDGLEKEKNKPINKPSETQNIPKTRNNGAWEVIEIKENK